MDLRPQPLILGLGPQSRLSVSGRAAPRVAGAEPTQVATLVPVALSFLAPGQGVKRFAWVTRLCQRPPHSHCSDTRQTVLWIPSSLRVSWGSRVWWKTHPVLGRPECRED